MLSDTETLLKIAEIAHMTFPGAAGASISNETTADDIEGWDSLSHALFLMNVERAFEIEFDPEDVIDLENIGALVLLVGRFHQDGNRR